MWRNKRGANSGDRYEKSREDVNWKKLPNTLLPLQAVCAFVLCFFFRSPMVIAVSPSAQRAMIACFLEVAVGQSSATAREALQAARWVVDDALELFYMGNQTLPAVTSSVIPLAVAAVPLTTCNDSCNPLPLQVARENLPAAEFSASAHLAALVEARKQKRPCVEARKPKFPCAEVDLVAASSRTQDSGLCCPSCAAPVPGLNCVPSESVVPKKRNARTSSGQLNAAGAVRGPGCASSVLPAHRTRSAKRTRAEMVAANPAFKPAPSFIGAPRRPRRTNAQIDGAASFSASRVVNCEAALVGAVQSGLHSGQKYSTQTSTAMVVFALTF